MADLSKLKAFADALTPFIKDLFTRAEANDSVGDGNVTQVNTAIAHLNDVLADAGDPFSADQTARMFAVSAVLSVFTLIRDQSQTRKVGLDPARAKLVNDTINDLAQEIFFLAQETVLSSLKFLLSPNDLILVMAQVAAVQQGIVEKQQAQAAIDTTIQLAIVAAKVAEMVA